MSIHSHINIGDIQIQLGNLCFMLYGSNVSTYQLKSCRPIYADNSFITFPQSSVTALVFSLYLDIRFIYSV